MKTTNRDFNTFKVWCLHYQQQFGLTNYKLCFEHSEDLDNYATIRIDHSGFIACVNLSTTIDKHGNIKQLAKHEMIHLLVAGLRHLACLRFVSEQAVELAEEDIVRRLENVIE